MNLPPPARAKANGSPLRPVRFGRQIKVDIETIRRLEHLFSLGLRFREQAADAETEAESIAAHEHLEAVAVECCELLGFDPEYDTPEADAAKSIILFGCDVAKTLEEINDGLSIRHHLQSTGEISDDD